MNRVFFIGNLARDPEYTQTAAGTSICRFTIAVNRPYADGNGERQTDFFNCTAWRGLGESVARYCVKGNKIAVTGCIQIRTYEDNRGVKQTTVDIIVQDCEFLSSPKREDGEIGAGSVPQQRQTPARATQMSFDDKGDIS